MRAHPDHADRSQPLYPRDVPRPSNAGRPPSARIALTFCTALLTTLLASCSAAPDVVEGIHKMCGEGNQGLYRVTRTEEDTPDIDFDEVCLAAIPGSDARSCTLRAALNTAAVCGGSHTIELTNTTYTLDQEYQASAPLQSREQVQYRRVGEVGLPRVFGTVTIEGHGAVIQRGPRAARFFRFFHIPPNGSLTLNDVVLRGGYARPDGGRMDAAYGGAIHNEGRLVTNRVVFDSNRAQPRGGSGRGGAVYNSGTFIADFTRFEANASESGAALFNAGIVRLSDSRLAHNNADGQSGGIEHQMGGLTVARSTFVENGSISSGGAVRIQQGIVEIEQTTFSSNQGINAGGIWVMGGSLKIRRSTFQGQMGGLNGAVWCDGSSATVLFEDVTITGNTARAIGGVSVSGGCAATFSNTIVAANRPTDCGFTREPTREGNNLDSDSSCRFPRTASDPDLLPLGNYGGPTPTMLPDRDSPAVDNGDPGRCRGFDQRDEPRSSMPCDIGAVERQPGDASSSGGSAKSGPPSAAAGKATVSLTIPPGPLRGSQARRTHRQTTSVTTCSMAARPPSTNEH